MDFYLAAIIFIRLSITLTSSSTLLRFPEMLFIMTLRSSEATLSSVNLASLTDCGRSYSTVSFSFANLEELGATSYDYSDPYL